MGEQVILEKASKLSSAATAQEDHTNDNEGVSWGIDMNDLSENDNEMSNKLPSIEEMTSISQLDSSSTMIPPQCKKIYEKFMTKKNKLYNIQLENERSREVELTKEIQDLYQSLMTSIQGNGDGK